MSSQTQNMLGLGKNKSLLKEYITDVFSRVVYLKDSTEFQLYLFNPTKYPIGAEIFINGDKISNRLLIIRPAESIWVERYIDNPSRFKFETYTVSSFDGVDDIIKYNGEVTVKFYKEIKEHSYVEVSSSPSTWYYNTNYSNTLSLKNNNLNYSDMVLNESIPSAYIMNITCDKATYSIANTCAANISTTQVEQPVKETGRINEGSYSNQQFKSTNMKFASYPFDTETIHILPESCKPLTSHDINKRYCTNCGKKLNTKYKFCPLCGTKVE